MIAGESQKLIAALFLIASLLPSAYLLSPRAAEAQSPLNAASAGQSPSTGAQNEVGFKNNIGQGVGSAVGNITACIGSLASGFLANLGIGAATTAASAAGAVTAVASGIPVSDNYTHAQLVLLNGTIASGLAQIATANWTTTTKECVLDGLVILIREVLISQMVRSIVNWINSGFDGNPSFVTNPSLFLQDVADQVAGEFIGGAGLSFVCSPFQLQIRRALALSYSSRLRNACTLSGIVRNIDNFFNGGFDETGWDALFAISNNPSNTAIGSFFQADTELSIRIVNAQGQEIKLLDWGQGFLSFRDPSCTAQAEQKGIPRTTCPIVTPGGLLNTHLSRAMGTEFNQLELADEINEIIGALVGQLVQNLFSPGGLLGLSKGNFGESSYVDQLVRNAEQDQFSGFVQAVGVSLDGNLKNISTYLAIKQNSLNRVRGSEDLLTSLHSCYANKADGIGITLTSGERETALERAREATTTLSSQVIPFIAPLTEAIASTTQTGVDLQFLAGQLAAASTTAEINSIQQEIQRISARGAIPDNTAILIATEEARRVERILDTIDTTTRTKVDECKAFPENGSSN